MMILSFKQIKRNNRVLLTVLFCIMAAFSLNAQKPYGTKTSPATYEDTYWLKAGTGVSTNASGNVTSWTDGGFTFVSTGTIKSDNSGSGEGIMNYNPAIVFPRLSTANSNRNLYANTSSTHNTSGYSTYVFAVSYLYGDNPTTAVYFAFQPNLNNDNFGWNKANGYPIVRGQNGTSFDASPGIGKSNGITSFILGNNNTTGTVSQVYQNGQMVRNGNNFRLMNASYRNVIGNSNAASTANYFSGTIQELIVIKQSGVGNVMNQTDREKIQSYLAIKYGIALQGEQQHYYNSAQNPIKVWDNLTNTGYNNDVFGIARDDGFGLYQKQSYSYSNKIVSVFVGSSLTTTNAANTGTLTDGTYLLFGSNGLSGQEEYSYTSGTTFNNTTISADLNQRYAEVLKAQLTGEPSLIIKIRSHLEKGQYILVSQDPTFNPLNTDVYTLASHTSGDIEIHDGDYICCAFYESTVYGNFPYFQPFLASTQPSEVSLAAVSAGSNAAVFTNEGLRLTPAAANQFGAVFINDRKFGSKNGIHIEFEYMVYGSSTGSNNADGFSVFFFDDAVTNPQIGGSGAALGYSYVRANNSYPSNRRRGLTGAYLGIGFDNWGNFKKTQFWGNEIIGGTQQLVNTPDANLGKSHVTLRGAEGHGYPNSTNPINGMTDGRTGYPVLISQSTLSGTPTNHEYIYLNNSGDHVISGNNSNYTGDFTIRGGAAFTSDNDPAYRKAIIEMYPDGTTDGMYVTVKIQHGKTVETVIDNYFYKEQTLYRETAIVHNTNGDNSSGSLPTNPIVSGVLTLDTKIHDFLKIGFAASTGSYNDIHLIKNLKITLPGAAEAYDDVASTETSVSVNVNPLQNDVAYQGPIVQNQVGSSAYVDPASFKFHSMDGSIAGNDYTYYAPEGIWAYNPVSGIIVFTPDPSFRGWAQIQYSIKGGLSGHVIPYGEEAYRSLPATITVEVRPGASFYDRPLNIISDTTGCIVLMPEDIPFGIKKKFSTENGNPASGYCIDGFTSPIVGDLNGDGKPEIVMLGVTGGIGGTARNDARYINIYNGQDGSRMFRHDFGTTYPQNAGTGYHRPTSALAIADIDNDGIGEIVYTRPDGRVLAYKPIFDGTTITSLNQMWEGNINGTYVSYRAPLTTTVFNVPNPYIADINEDGIPEVIVYNKVFDGATGNLLMSWQGSAASPVASSATSSSGLVNNVSADPTTSANAANIRAVAMTGRRPGNGTYADEYITTPAVWDIDGDGIQEIITGNRIHKIQINSLINHTSNTYTTIEGPQYVDLNEGTSGAAKRIYLSDGHTRVADIDGDGYLDIIVVSYANNGSLDVKVLVYVWDPRFPNDVKAALTYISDGSNGNISIPFVGDINGKNDGWDGTEYTKKLPEICILAGAAQINRAYASANNSGRTGIKFHPLSDESLRQGTASGTGIAAGWDNNQASNSNRRFNRTTTNDANQFNGHIIGLTYDASVVDIQDRLKLSWGLEHTDRSHQTGITLFDFDNDGAKDLCYRDETTLRVISPKSANNGLGSDYVTLNEDVGTPGTSIMFKTPVYGGTGSEYPSIADVNLDGSADILITQSSNSQDINASRGWINVYEYQGHKWAPCPPVWNQGLYNPLHINENLSVPIHPQPLLTEYLDINGDTITPYNGAWIQQPIVQQGQPYRPVYRIPDAILSDMKVTVNMTGATPTGATIELTIRNTGSASINANTPIAFYANNVGVDNFSQAIFVTTQPVGKDVFPTETYIGTYNISGDFNEKLIWARITDDGTTFPAENYDDCDVNNNMRKGIDCPYLEYTIVSEPAGLNVICGEYGAVVLKAVPSETPHATPIYTWYNGDVEIANSNHQYYIATEAGDYRCFVVENICSTFTTNTYTITKSGSTYGDQPLLSSIPADAKICSGNGHVYVYISNYETESATYYLYKDNELYAGPSANNFAFVSDAGDYVAIVALGTCTFVSNTLTIGENTGSSMVTPVIENVYSGNLCTNGGKTLLQVSSPAHILGLQYQWYLNGRHIEGANQRWYIATEAGVYSISIYTLSGCSDVSSSITIASSVGTIEVPVITKNPDVNYICINGGLIMEVSNYDSYSSPTYTWYKNGSIVQTGTNRLYSVTDAGSYFVVVETSTCTSISDEYLIEAENSGAIANVPTLSFDPGLSMCAGGTTQISVSNQNLFPGATYLWYRNNVVVKSGTEYVYYATSDGTYFVQVVDGTCSATSVRETLTMGLSEIDTAVLVVYPSPSHVVCGANGVVVVRLTTTYPAGTTYQWYKNGIALAGENTKLLSTNEIGNYYVEIRQAACSAVSATITVTIDNLCDIDTPIIAANPEEIIGTDLVELSLQNVASYSPTAQYYWFFNTDSLVYEDDQYIYNTNVEGYYKLLVVDNGKAAWSNEIYLAESVCPTATPTLSVLPSSLNICSDNGSVYFALTNIGSFTTSAVYQWYRNNTLISGVSTPYYNATQDGSYYLRVIDGLCQGFSSTYVVNKSVTIVIPDLVIRMTPSSGNLCIGGSVSLFVYNRGAYASDVTYQWYKNGLLIAGATDNVYEVNNTNQAENQAVYTAQVITSAGCGVMSAESLTVNKQASSAITPEIAASGTKVCVGGGKILLRFTNADDYGTGTTLYYQWFLDNDLIGGATASTYEATLGGSYKLQVVTGLCGAFSAPIALEGSSSTIEVPLVASYPAGLTTVCDGGMLLLVVTNVGDYATPAYQWYDYNEPISGATNSSLEVTARGRYRVQVSDGECSSLSSNIQINESASGIIQPQIAVIPTSNQICGDDGAVILMLFNDESDYLSPVYQWYKDNTPISGANEKLYIATAAGSYRLSVVDGSCGAISLEKVITKTTDDIDKPIITSVPSGNALCGSGSVVRMTVSNASSYSTPVAYIWYYENEIVQNGTQNYYDATLAGDYIIQVVENGICSSVETITITDGGGAGFTPVIASVTSSVALCEDAGAVVLELSDLGDYAGAIYQWYKDGAAIASATEHLYVATATGDYKLLVLLGECAVYSNIITVVPGTATVEIAEPILVFVPNSGNLCGAGSEVALSVANTTDYTTPSFYWYKDNIQVGTGASYIATTIGNYFVVVGDEGCSSLSSTHTVIDNGASITPAIVSVTSYDALCEDAGAVVLELSDLDDYSGATYQWYKDGTAIASATEHLYVATATGDYKLLVLLGECAVYSNTITVVPGTATVEIAEPILAFVPSSGNLCGAGSEVTLSIANTTDYTTPSFYWYKDNIQVGTGTSYVATEAGNYFVVVGDEGCSSLSSTHTVTDNGASITPAIVSVTSYDALCEDAGAIVLELSDLDDYIGASYQWYKDGTAVASATEHLYVAITTGDYKLLVLLGECAVYSNTITVVPGTATVEIAEPILAFVPTSGNLCGASSEVILSVANTSDYIAPTFYWYKDNVQVGTGASYTATAAGDYFVVVGDGDCSAISATHTVTDNGSSITPQIASVTGSVALCEDAGAVVLELNNLSSYTGATYKWYKDGVAIASATNHIYTATATGEYKLLVLLGECAVYSNTITVVPGIATVEIAEPILTFVPTTGELCGPSSEVILSVANTSDYTAPTFYWYKNNIQVGTGASYVATTIGDYFVVVGDEGCSSLSATHTVVESGNILSPAIVSVSGSTVLCVGGTLVLELDDYASYAGASLQWYKNNIVIAGATSHTLVTSTVGNYKLHMIYNDCAAYSNIIEITESATGDEIAKPMLSFIPESGTLCGPMSEVTMYVSNVSEYTLPIFTWYKDGIQVGTGASYTTTETGLYFVIVTDGGCTAASNTHNVTDNGSSIEPVIYSVTGGLILCEDGGKVLLELEDFDMYAGATLQWYRNDSPISGANEHLYVAEEAGNYKLHVLYQTCSVFTNTLAITNGTSGTLIEIPQLSFIPESGQLCGQFSLVIMSVENINSYDNPEFLWYRNNIYVGNGSEFTTNQEGNYFVVVSDGECTSVSDIHTINNMAYNIERPIITSLPASNVICGDDGVVLLRLMNIGDYYNPTLQWYKDGAPIAGATEYIYNATEAGTYKLLVIDDICSVFSSDIVVTSSPTGISEPIISSFPLDAKIYNNNPVEMFLINVDDYVSPQFYWYSVHQNIIVGNNLSSYSTLVLGTYRLLVVDGGCSAWSNEISITQGTCPTITFDVSDILTCSGAMVDLNDAVSNLPANNVAHFYSDPALQNEVYHIVYGVTSTTYFARSIDTTTLCTSEVYTITVIGVTPPTATVGGTYVVESGETVNIPVILTGTAPWTLTYNANGTNEQQVVVTASPYFISEVFPSGTTYVNLVSVATGDCQGIATGTATIIVRTELSIIFGEDSQICKGGLAELYVILTGTAPWEVVYSDGYEEFTLRDINTTYYTWFVSPEQTTVYNLVSVKDAHNFIDNLNQTVTVTVAASATELIVLDAYYEVCQTDVYAIINYTSDQYPLEYKLDFPIETNLLGFSDITDYISMPVGEFYIELPNNIEIGNYYAELYVKNAQGCEDVYLLFIRIYGLPYINTQPENHIDMCEGTDLVLSVEAVGVGLTYQWYKDGFAIDGATSSVYVETYHEGLNGYYYVEVFGRCSGSSGIVSYAVEVSQGKFYIMRKWDNILFVDNFDREYVEYQWYKNGVAIAVEGKSQYLQLACNVDGAEYTVRAYFADGTSILSCPVMISTDGCVSSTSIYPNPVNNNETVTVIIDNIYDRTHTIEIVDVTGKLMYLTKTNESKLQIPIKLATGVYVVRISSDSGKYFNNKLIVK